MALAAFDQFQSTFMEKARIFKKAFTGVQSEFGPSWESELSAHLEKLFGDDQETYNKAIQGYSKFALDAMRLQQRFNKTRKYEDVSYEEACEKVYMNDEYMCNLYLPGILISHFLWPHHYRQFLFYKNNFLPLLDNLDDKRFYEVGTGTGFYTVQIFRYDPAFKGIGIDISPHSRQFTLNNVRRWGFGDSFTSLDVNVIGADLEPLPCVQCIEVLEHLSDPEVFLKHLRKLLAPGGVGFITAALTAPNADHIYLYWTPDDVIRQLTAAGFRVQDYTEEAAYEGAEGELVPKVAAFVVT
jgi:SAM-dependent methyltransferase